MNRNARGDEGSTQRSFIAAGGLANHEARRLKPGGEARFVSDRVRAAASGVPRLDPGVAMTRSLRPDRTFRYPTFFVAAGFAGCFSAAGFWGAPPAIGNSISR